jgi:phosphate-selective porin OprO and OprP
VKHVTRSIAAAVCLLLLPLAAFAQDPADKPQAADQEGKGGLRFVWTHRPSLRAGHMFRMDFRVKLHGDFRNFSTDETPVDTFDMPRKRIGIQGNFLRHFEYQVERELKHDNPWRDVFLNFRYFRDVQIEAGKFKIPFSLDQLTGETDNDFVYRSRLGDLLAPGRDVGVMVHGRVLDRALSYQGGMFRHDGDNAQFGDNPGAGGTVAGRVTAAPLRPLVSDESPFADLTAGFAMTSGDGPEGLNSLRAESIWETARVSSDVYVKGRRQRLGLEELWEPGPFSVKSEYARVSEERLGQGLGDEDLPEVVWRGWYVSGTWVVTGEKKAGGIEPHRPLFQHGVGAIEGAARFDRLRVGSSAPGEPPETNPRAVNFATHGEGIWTFGINWYVNRWVKIQLNGIRETFDDVDRSPRPGRATFVTGVCRLQFVL